MKKYTFLLSLFWAAIQVVSAQTVTYLEYSIDGFVAEGDGISIELSGSSSELDTALNIDVSTLEPGIHTLHFRTRNDEGVWSFAAVRSFYIPEPDVDSAIVAVEYAFDNTVKEGSGELITMETNNSRLDSTFLFDVSGMEPGIHDIYMRSKNIMGVWSFQSSGTFVVLEPDTTKIEEIYYRIYNSDYESSWMTAQVNPARKDVDSTIMLSAAGLDYNETYSIELYAENSKDVPGFPVVLSNLTLRQNVPPVALTDTLELMMSENQNLSISMDTLFDDSDLMFGDSLDYKIVWADSVGLLDFTAWENNKLLSLMPGSGHRGEYQFLLETSDLALETDSIFVMLTITGPTAVNSTAAESRFLIYPNPTRSHLKVKSLSNGMEAYGLKFYNSSGQLLFSQQVTEKEFVMDVEKYSSGIYLLLLVTDEAPYRRTIVVE